MAEIDKQLCSDCYFFRYDGEPGSSGFKVNINGEGSCANPVVIQGIKGEPREINQSFTTRQSLEKLRLTDLAATLEAGNQTCFKFGGLEFDDEAIDSLVPTEEEKKIWAREDCLSSDS